MSMAPSALSVVFPVAAVTWAAAPTVPLSETPRFA